MRFTVPLTQIRTPELKPIPRGYSIREATGSPEDREAWDKIVSTFRPGEPYPDGLGDKVWFADYYGEPVGFESVVLPETPNNTVYMWTGVMLHGHRNKGLHNAITYHRIEYARKTGREYVRVACRSTLDNWWRRHTIE